MSMSEFVTPVRVQAGVLKIRDRAHFEAGLKAMRDGEYLCRIEKLRATRSNDLNSLYWVGYVQPIAEYTGSTDKQTHAYLKHSFLPRNHFVIRDSAGEIVDEIDLDALTTTTLTTEEFKVYLKEIEALAVSLRVKVGSDRGE